MLSTLEEITAAAMTLPVKDRESLVDTLIDSVEQNGETLAPEEIEELRRRAREVVEDPKATITVEQSMREIRQSLGIAP